MGARGNKTENTKKRKRRKRKKGRKKRSGNKDLPTDWKDKNTVGLKIFTNNCRGFNSKRESIYKDVVEKLKPDIINLSETLLRNKAKASHKDYVSFNQNRADGAGGGGIVTMVANDLKAHATKVTSSNTNDEFMITRLDHVKPALNIVHVYGQNEGRAGQHKVLEGWKEILLELGKIESRNELALVVGDLNRAVGNKELGVEGNTDKVSYGGRLVRELIGAGDYVMLNNLSLTEGGPWTRICPATGRGSCMDLAIGSRDLVQFVTKVQVDSAKVNTPRREVIKKGVLGLTYTDHYPLLL